MQSQILTDLVQILETGTEADVSQFVKEHWKELPQKLQDHLAVTILIDAIDANEKQSRNFEEIRENFFDILEEIEKQELEESPQKLQ